MIGYRACRAALFLLAAMLALPAGLPAARAADAVPAGSTIAGVDPGKVDDLVAAYRILAMKGVLDSFGHVSIRDPRDPAHYLISHALAPSLVTAKDIVVLDMNSAPVDPAEKRGLYVERFIHSEIYKARPDVLAIVHSHSPTVVPFGVSDVPFRPILHNAGFLGNDVPVFDIHKQFGDTDLLVRDQAKGRALAASLGNHTVVLMRGHGDAVVGSTIQIAVWRAYYTEVNARMLGAAHALGGHITYLTPGEDKLTNDAMIIAAGHRPWQEWKSEVGMGGAGPGAK